MNHGTTAGSGFSRRQLLRAAGIGGTAIAASATTLFNAPSAWAETREKGGCQYVSGVDVIPDTSHATSALAAHIRGYFQAKSDKDLDWQTSYYSDRLFTYIDAILGWHWYSRQALRDALTQWYPTWPKDSKSYPTRILGDTTSAILLFTDTPGMFGPGQVRNAGAVNFNREGKIITALELDAWGKIERFTAVWNGALADDALLTALARNAIEQ